MYRSVGPHVADFSGDSPRSQYPNPTVYSRFGAASPFRLVLTVKPHSDWNQEHAGVSNHLRPTLRLRHRRACSGASIYLIVKELVELRFSQSLNSGDSIARLSRCAACQCRRFDGVDPEPQVVGSTPDPVWTHVLRSSYRIRDTGHLQLVERQV
jgi:hypothetical protein